MSKPTTWTEKMNNPEKSQRKMTPKGMMYISTPKEIEEVIMTIPKGKLMTPGAIAERLAKKYDSDFTCPLTTGIFLSIVANFTEEQRSLGEKSLAPYWRVVKPKGIIYDKYLGQPSHQREYLESEGYTIEASKNKKNLVVKDVEKFLVN